MRLGSHHSAASRAKMTASRTGKTLTAEHRANLSGENNHSFGKHFSEEHKKRISASTSGELNHNFGKHHTEETKKKQRDAVLGELNPFFGKTHSEESLQQMSDAHLGIPLSPEHRAAIGASLLGGHRSDESKKRMSIAQLGRPPASDEARLNMSKRQLGELNCNWGKPRSDAAKKAIGDGNRGKVRSEEACARIAEANRGEKSPFWRGGVSTSPYPLTWTRILRRRIRARDTYTCQLCGVRWSKGMWVLSVHHIDYVKSHCDPMNLIALCHKCHGKTNTIVREFWTGLFQMFMEEREIQKTSVGVDRQTKVA